MSYKEKCYIFIIVNPTVEIIVSRIIEDLEINNVPKASILILHPKEYKPLMIKDLRIVSYDYINNSFDYKSQKYNNLKLKIQFFLYLFRRSSSVFGKRIYRRLGKLPVSIIKLHSYRKFINELSLKNKEIFIYTPNVKVHIFQILIFYTRNYNYHILEEGAVSFKSINETEQLFTNDLRLLAADLISDILFKFILVIRLISVFLNKYFLNSKIPFSILSKYINAPIFKEGMFFLHEYKPLSFNKFSENAFSTFKNQGVDILLFNKLSRYEILKKREVIKIIKDSKIDNIFILILPGDNINILKQEFNNKKTSIFNPDNLILRPHPRFSDYSIKKLSNILKIKILDENIKLSERLRAIPLELFYNLKEIRLVFTGLQKSSLLTYCDNENIKYLIY